MTPAIRAISSSKFVYKVHEYAHDNSASSYGLEAAEKLRVPPQRVFKTLVVKLDQKELAVGIVPVASTLNMKRMARALGAKKAEMAPALEVERSTGYVLGGVSPLGQKKQLRTVIDASALDVPSIFISGGRRGLEIELAGQDLCTLTSGLAANLCHK